MSLAADLKLVKNIQNEGDRRHIRIGNDVVLGARKICLMAGPCSVESEEQLFSVARLVAKHGAQVLRGGVYKPRTSPYSFQGLGLDGLEILKVARKEIGIPIITEVLDVRLIEKMYDYVDVFQVGSRNMYNYPLLKELGATKKPVLLKRGMMATIEEFLSAAEYLLSRGNQDVILCERGIRSFDTNTRFCLDLSAIPVLREKTQLPIIVDPSHGTGVSRYIESMSLAAIAAGADGLLIEVHNDPENALSDGKQALSFDQFKSLTQKLAKIVPALNREL